MKNPPRPRTRSKGQKIFNLKTRKKLPNPTIMCGRFWDDSPNPYTSPIAFCAPGPEYGPCTLLIACSGHHSFPRPNRVTHRSRGSQN